MRRFVELQRRGQSTAKPNVYRELDKLALHGFLTKENAGYLAVKGMKINIVER
jgi:Fe2+ or Zn2+ uptake regulation protein